MNKISRSLEGSKNQTQAYSVEEIIELLKIKTLLAKDNDN